MVVLESRLQEGGGSHGLSGEEHSRLRTQRPQDSEAGGYGMCLRNVKEAGVSGAGTLSTILVGDGPPDPPRGLGCLV